MNLLITESRNISKHIMIALNATLMSMTLRPYYQSIANPTMDFSVRVSNPQNFYIQDKSNARDILKRYNNNIVRLIRDASKNKTNIFLAFDIDEGGDFSANLLRYKLIQEGVDEKRIHRLAMLEAKHSKVSLAFKDFSSPADVLEHIAIDIDEQRMMNIYGTHMGIRALETIYRIQEKKNGEVRINSQGIALATYLHQCTKKS